MSKKNLSKEMKETGKIVVGSPEVKQRKPFAPKTKVQPDKTKYKRKGKNFDEDEEQSTVPLRKNVSKNDDLGEVPLKPDHWDKSKKKNGKFSKFGKKIKDKVGGLVNKSVSGGKLDENTNIEKFIGSILTKNYAAADKYIKQAVECKLQDKIEQELSTPLF